MKDPVEGKFYEKQLLRAPIPDYQKDFFFVEKILHTKIVKRQKYALVKYLYYQNIIKRLTNLNKNTEGRKNIPESKQVMNWLNK